MYLPSSDIDKVAIEYLTEVIAPKLPIGPKYVLFFGVGMLSNNITQKMLPTIEALGLLDEHKRIDLEKAKIAATDAMTKVGGKLPMYGYVADQVDIEAIYNIARKYSTP